MTSTPPPSQLPLSVCYDHQDDGTYLIFGQPPSVETQQWLNSRPSIGGKTKCAYLSGRGYWRIGQGKWPETKEYLEAKGYALGPAQIKKARRHERFDTEKIVGSALKRVEEKKVTLAEFDWSGFPEWAATNLTIKSKKPGEVGRFVPFVLNNPQRKLFMAMLSQWERRKRIRINVLKNRQVGLSTFIQGFCFYLALNVPGVEALITAHRDDAADAVFHRTKLFETHCPEKKPTKYSRREEIEWEAPHHSAIRVMVAGGDEDAGRAEMRQVYHASEAALYNERGLDTYANVMASIPDEPGTFVWRETTAKGQNWYYDAWNSPEAEGFENFFTGYLDDDTCRLYGVMLDDPCWLNLARSWKDDEPRIRAMAVEMGLPETEAVAAIAWRRRTIPSKSRANVKIFNRENPLVPDDAYTATGGHVFDIEIVDVERKRLAAKESENPTPRYSVLITDEVTGAWKIEKNNEVGPLLIWKQPIPGVPYAISGDFGRGRNVSGDTGDPDKLDYTAMLVWNEWTRECVAAWHGRIDPDQAADVMCALGHKYNSALLVPETNHYGMILIAKIVKIRRYPRVFRKEKVDKATATPVLQDPDAHWMERGWWTTPQSKPNMIEWLQEAVRDRTLKIDFELFWSECRTYVMDEDGATNAESGKHDDVVLAASIFAAFARLHPKHLVEVKEVPSPYTPTTDGVLVSSAHLIAKIEAKRKERESKKSGRSGGFR